MSNKDQNIRRDAGARWVLPRLLLGVALALACEASGEIALPTVSWSSDDFEFATELNEPLCTGTLTYQQRFVDLAQLMFGEPPDGRRFTFYLLSPTTFEELFGDLQGAYINDQVFAKTIPQFHELTHAVVDLSLGMSHPFFNEGIAEVFRDRYSTNRAPIGSIDDALAMDTTHGTLEAALYGRAGHFMAYALDVHGVDATVALLASARPGDSAETLQADIEDAFGMAYHDVLVDYENYPLCDHDAFRWPITECDVGATVPEVSGAWTVDIESDCTAEAAIGPRAGEVWVINTVDIPSDGAYLISVFGAPDDNAYIVLDHCSPGCAPDKGNYVDARHTKQLQLRQGRHQITTVTLSLPSGRLRTRIERIGPKTLTNRP